MSSGALQVNKFKAAFERTMQNLASISSVLLIFSLLRDVEEAFQFITDSPIIALAALLLFAGLFIYNLISSSKSQRKLRLSAPSAVEAKVPGAEQKEDDLEREAKVSTAEQRESGAEREAGARRRLVPIGITVSLAALLAIAAILYVLAFSGVHFVILASYPEPEVFKHAQAMNERLSELESGDIQVRVGRSRPSNPSQPIMLSGTYFSAESARRAYTEASAILQDHVISRYTGEKPYLVSHYLFGRQSFGSVNK